MFGGLFDFLIQAVLIIDEDDIKTFKYGKSSEDDYVEEYKEDYEENFAKETDVLESYNDYLQSFEDALEDYNFVTWL